MAEDNISAVLTCVAETKSTAIFTWNICFDRPQTYKMAKFRIKIFFLYRLKPQKPRPQKSVSKTMHGQTVGDCVDNMMYGQLVIVLTTRCMDRQLVIVLT